MDLPAGHEAAKQAGPVRNDYVRRALNSFRGPEYLWVGRAGEPTDPGDCR